tara:strand:- start:6888 stop:8813 length:1926 start_codon:yes stop_codon:yes gene_type:complete
MCGIVGYFSKNQTDSDLIKKMTKKLIHRGPDSIGYFSDFEAKLHFGHTRLSILDLKNSGSQPMHSFSKRFTIIFNGEIYNYLELKAIIDKSKKIDWLGTSDTEVLINFIEIFGIKKCLEKIKGMFVFVIYDKKNKKIILCKDYFGEKPLYFGNSNNKFYFASELKAITEDPSFIKKINNQAISYLMSINYVPSPISIFKNIHKLKPGHYLEINLNNHNFNINTFFQIDYRKKFNPSESKNIPLNLAKKNLKTLLENSVEQKMQSDVDLGCFLSSGIDSSLITSIVNKIYKKKLNTFSLGYDESLYDESSDAEKIANSINTNHHTIKFNNNSIHDIVEDLGNKYCEPFSDSSQIPTLFLSKFVSNEVKVCFSGDGGDELFAGYNRYINNNKVLSLYNNSSIINSILFKIISSNKFYKFFDFLNKSKIKTPNILKINNLVEKSRTLNEALKHNDLFSFYFRFLSHWGFDELNINKEKEENYMSDFWNFENNFMRTIMNFDLNTYLPDDLLVKIDRSSMSYGLEVRCPFLDTDILEYSQKLPNEYLVNKSVGKLILRSLLQDYIPKNLINNQKKGFLFPLKNILRNDLRGWAEKLLTKEKIMSSNYFSYEMISTEWNSILYKNQGNEYKIWDYLVFQNWYEKNF